MITLSSGANNVYATLAEKAVSTNPTYAYVFQNDETKQVFMVTNTTTTVQDYLQKMVITVQASPNWLSGQVALSNYGFYHYWCYEVSDIIAIDYDAVVAYDPALLVTGFPSAFTGIVETGKMFYNGGAATINRYVNKVSAVKAYGD